MSDLFPFTSNRIVQKFSLFVLQVVTEDGLILITKRKEHLCSYDIEKLILDKVNHPNLPKLKYVFPLDNYYYWIAYEKIAGESLYDFMNSQPKPLEMNTLKSIIRDILEALKVMHRNGWVHHDLTTKNVIYNKNENRATLIDFDLSTHSDDIHPCEIPCEALVSPPEHCDPISKLSTTKLDIWSLGILILKLIENTNYVTKIIMNNLEKKFHNCTSEVDGDRPHVEKKDEKGKTIYVRDFMRHELLFKRYNDLKKEQETTGSYAFLNDFSNFIPEPLVDFVSLCLTWNHKFRPSTEELLENKFFI